MCRLCLLDASIACPVDPNQDALAIPICPANRADRACWVMWEHSFAHPASFATLNSITHTSGFLPHPCSVPPYMESQRSAK